MTKRAETGVKTKKAGAKSVNGRSKPATTSGRTTGSTTARNSRRAATVGATKSSGAKNAAGITGKSVSPKATTYARPTRNSGATTVIASMSGPTVEEIRCRAYEIHLGRGGMGGDPQADWLQAERELGAHSQT